MTDFFNKINNEAGLWVFRLVLVFVLETARRVEDEDEIKTTPFGRGFLFQYLKTGIHHDHFRRRIIRTTPASPSPVKTRMDGSGTVVMARLQLTSVL